MIDENLPIEEVRAIFAKDQFATMAGCTIVEASKHHAVCEMTLADMHLNAQGGIMGGAIFTLADFALAVSVNVGQPDTVAIDNNIRYLSAPKGEKLIATARMDKAGRSLAFVTVTVTDDTGRDVAVMTATGFRKA
ncbi:MAG: PaaI family thioesterase [Coriobacteriaceae bacterium]|nr:PaaI family thioesterase [Coriobacteriaceae bacterium]